MTAPADAKRCKAPESVTMESLLSRAVRVDGCLEWQGARNDKGYGQICVDGKMVYVHRISWSIANGPIPHGMLICHRCDNPPCFEPSHLFSGTSADNTADMIAKGRARHVMPPFKTHCDAGHPLPDGPPKKRKCKTCVAAYNKAYWETNGPEVNARRSQ